MLVWRCGQFQPSITGFRARGPDAEGDDFPVASLVQSGRDRITKGLCIGDRMIGRGDQHQRIGV